MTRALIWALALVGCGKGEIELGETGNAVPPTATDTDTDPHTDTDTAGLAFVGAPSAATPGAPWPTLSVTTSAEVTGTVLLTASGAPTLDGPLSAELLDGVATFEGLIAQGCGPVTLRASLDGATPAEVTVAVEPLLDATLPLAVASGAEPQWTLRLMDAGGATVAADGELTVDAGDDAIVAALVAGEASVSGPALTGPDELWLGVEVRAGDCELDGEVGPLLVGTSVSSAPVFLPSTRVGDDFVAVVGDLPPDAIVGPLPDWLALDPATGLAAGVPDAPGAITMELVGWEGDAIARRVVHLAVFDADDVQPAPADHPSDLGPHATDAFEITLPEVVTSRGSFTHVAVRVAFPSDGAGGVAAGRHPLVAFHHAAHSPADIYDAYTDLHAHWASHGVITASVDSRVNVEGQSQSWSNLSDMSIFQRAALDWMLDASADPASPFFDRVDADRLLVSGHSRGGGASLISLWEDPRLLGAMCFEQVSPLQTPYQDFDDPEANGDRPLPARPILILSAANDLDEPWPLVDSAYAQTVGPTALITLMGANHEDTYDAGTPGGVTSTSSIPVADRHDLDQHYSTAFLDRFAFGELGADPWLFGLPGMSSDLSELGVVAHGRRQMASALTVDDFQDGDAGSNPLGGSVVAADLSTNEDDHPFAEGLASAGRGDERSDRIGVWAQARHLGWAEGDATLTFALTPEGAGLDLSAQRRLVFRLHRDCAPPGWSGTGCDDDAPLALTATLQDASGSEASVDVASGLGELGVLGRYATSAILSLDDFVGVDLAEVTTVALRFDATAPGDGDLWLDDLRVE